MVAAAAANEAFLTANEYIDVLGEESGGGVPNFRTAGPGVNFVRRGSRRPTHRQESPELTHGRIVSAPISRAELAGWAEDQFGDWIKAVVDVSRGVMAVGGDLYADDEALLLADGSRQQDLWGINLHPEEEGDDWIEFDSMINIRPRYGNRSRGVDDEGTRARIRAIAERLVEAGHGS